MAEDLEDDLPAKYPDGEQAVDGVVDDSEKLSLDDAKLAPPTNKFLNPKLIKVAMIGLGGLSLFGLMIAFGDGGPPAQPENKASKAPKFDTQIPDNLALNESTYQSGTVKQPDPMSLSQRTLSPTGSSSNGSYVPTTQTPNLSAEPADTVPRYGTSRRDPTLSESVLVVSGQDNRPAQRQDAQGQSAGGQGSTGQPVDPDEAARRASPFFGSFSLDPTGGQGRGNGSQADLLKQVQATTATDYEKQNQQLAKNQFLASQTADYSTYQTNSWSNAIDPERELKQGTLIPITLVTEINSDLPGVIKAMVTGDKYNTYTGQNLLIPKGSTVLGHYDSSITFGQNKVLVVWDRIIRPDQMTLVIPGSQGVDSRGAAGLQDQVDNHFGDIAGAVAASTAFDLTINTTAGFIAGLPGMGTLPTGTIEKDAQAVTAIADRIAQKQLNRQPTIVIRAGTAGFISLNKDMIIPIYHEGLAF